MSLNPAGPVLDELGVELDLADDDRVTEVLLLAKTTNLDSGVVSLVIAANKGMDWISQLGLLTAAQQVLEQTDDE